MRALTSLLTVLALAACQTLPPAPETPTDFWLQGRLRITLPDEVISSNIRWAQTDTGFDAYLWGALGAGTTHLHGNSQRIHIENQRIRVSGAPQEVLATHLGWALPIELLISWIGGGPSEHMEVHDLKRSRQGFITSFRQADWLLEFLDLDATGRYARLRANSAEVEVLLVVKTRTDTAHSGYGPDQNMYSVRREFRPRPDRNTAKGYP